MSKTLIIAEKPSVANDLARVLAKAPGMAKFEKQKDYFENEKAIITSAVGHLVEQKMPTLPDGRALPWKFDALPVIPDEFELQASDGNKARLNMIVRFMKRKEVDLIINACDAGREGELIFRLIQKVAGVEKPVKRLWMQSMTNQSILDAYSNLRSDAEMTPLSDAAFCRSEADWLVGINATRAMTAFNSKYGGFNVTPVGRVQTPTLAILEQREVEIQDFVPRTYFEVYGEFGVKSGNYRGRWFDEAFKKSDEDPHARAERIWEKELAEQITGRCQGKPGVIEEKKKPSKQAPPLLYDLTSLQREANGRFGFSARRTLGLAQSLYERHKALTYPRTDSRYLPDDYIGTAKSTMGKIAAASGAIISDMPKHAAKADGNGWIKPNRRIFNGAKVSDHFAIIPTGQIPKSLDDAERKIYDMVSRRFIAVFFPPAEFELTTRITRITTGDVVDAFKTDGKILTVPGWREVYGKQAETDDNEEEGGSGKTITPAEPNESAKTESVEIEEKETRPPPRYTEATLLSMMETAGKLVDDDDLREAMSERGLGTPATRASIIEGLLSDKYIARDGRDIYVTTRGMRLIDQLRNMEMGQLASPEMTGEWEHKLKDMEHGKLPRPVFMNQIKDMTTNVVEIVKEYAKTALEREFPRFPAPCPKCGAPDLGQDDGRYKCTEPDCKFSIAKVVASRPLSEAEAKQLITTKHAGPFTGFVSRFKKPFDAALEIKDDWKVGFIFEKTEEEEAEAEAIKEENKLCKCPCCSEGHIYETPTSYVCNERIKGSGCKGRLSKVMCKLEIPREQALKFFTEGKTDLIEGFISKKGKPFSAKLGCNSKGRRMLSWEFPPRAAKKSATKKSSKKKTAKKKGAKATS